MGDDLKVHVGIVYYEGHQCYNMRPRESLSSEFARVTSLICEEWPFFQMNEVGSTAFQIHFFYFA